jgi:hypothetical protein
VRNHGAMTPSWLRLSVCLWSVQGCAAPIPGPSAGPAPRVAVSATTAKVTAEPERDRDATPLEDSDGAALLQTFLRLHAGTLDGALAAPELRWRLLRTCDARWTAELVRRVERVMPDGSLEADAARRSAFQDEYFWQSTASEVLGCIGASEAVEPLVKVLLDSKKSDVH